MPSPSLFDIRDELSNALSGVFTEKSYAWVGTVQTPCAVVEIDSINYETTFDPDRVTYMFDVIVLVALTPTAEIAARALDQYLSPFGDSSVAQALRADPSLGGLVQTLIVQGVRSNDYGEMKIQGETYFGAVIKVEIFV